MNNTQTIEQVRTDEEYKIAIDDCIKEMEQMRIEMESDQSRIDSLQAETRSLLTQLKELKKNNTPT